jgi:hypothetical protein
MDSVKDFHETTQKLFQFYLFNNVTAKNFWGNTFVYTTQILVLGDIFAI